MNVRAKRSDLIDITGNTYFRLTVLSYAGDSKWNCKCECGTVKVVQGGHLRNGGTVGCGCFHKTKPLTHGKCYTPEYGSYQGMKDRCYNKNSERYADYGGRGITVCDRWLESFDNFYADMGARSSPRHSLDRIDNNSDYEPNNCRWATNSEQTRNRRIFKNNTSGVVGVSWNKRDKRWAATITANGRQENLGTFIDKEDAIAARKEGELVYHS